MTGKDSLIEEMAKIIRPVLTDRTHIAFIPALDKPIAQELYEQGYRKINMDKWKRILDRNRKELQRLRDNEENLSKFGQHDLGYFKGRVSVLEDLFDELDIEVDDNG